MDGQAKHAGHIGSKLTQFTYAEARRRYSTVAYLQERTTAMAAQLPHTFATCGEWELYKESMLPRLSSLLNFPTRVPMVAEVLDERCVNNYVRERVDYHFDGERFIPCFVTRPARSSRGRCPAVVLSPGWGDHKGVASFNHIAEQWAQEGFITVIPDHAPFGEAADGPLPEAMVNISGTGMAIGLPYEALRAFALLRAYDYLVSREDVDAQRIGIAGLCQGAIDLWWAATYEPGFKAIGPTCGTTTYEAWARDYINFGNLSDVSPYLPNILRVCDVQHIYASWAPRPVLIQSNINDNWWPLSGFDQVVTLSRQVYGLYGAPERFVAHLDNEVHDITPLFAARLLTFFKRWLTDDRVITP